MNEILCFQLSLSVIPVATSGTKPNEHAPMPANHKRAESLGNGRFPERPLACTSPEAAIMSVVLPDAAPYRAGGALTVSSAQHNRCPQGF